MILEELQYMNEIFGRAVNQYQKITVKYPQPNYTALKLGEEAGEVIQAMVHYAEGRDYIWDDVEMEVVQTIAVLFRLLIEGDQVNGIIPPHVKEERTVGVKDAE